MLFMEKLEKYYQTFCGRSGADLVVCNFFTNCASKFWKIHPEEKICPSLNSFAMNAVIHSKNYCVILTQSVVSFAHHVAVNK